MTQPMRDTSAETLRFSHGDTALGTIIVAESVRGVTALFIGDDRMKLLRDLKGRWGVQRKRRLINVEGVALWTSSCA